ncbi:hypothetical protein LY28_00442 [Ruminiclostridium sufflavum DSM 19573]|uniref:Uncharacterized protein n=1 Tax=Ruminiclostridium sufflavum DSM 19573 TaxID=1121337 RepID=A0A318XNW4_9FIRM|nr:hypothetical protein [Ruminiclostridium sufflavum]PYG89845.1 hypothetical protein LY28_00442 [Ruminiclostridium sufflavum DSM 19573]
METIMKIPFLLALIASIITGAISIVNNADTNKTCISMIMAMIIFYIVGILIRNTLSNIIEEQNNQKLEAEKKLREEEMLEKAKAALKSKKAEHLGKNLDLVTEDEIDDGFTPFDLSQAVKAKMNE